MTRSTLSNYLGLLTAATIAACSPAITMDGGSDSGTNDVTSDIARDAASDTQPDVAPDALPDVAPDVPIVDAPMDVPADAPPIVARTTQTNGSAIAIAVDDHAVVAANRTADSISVFSSDFTTTPATLSRTAQLSTGANSRPWAVVIGSDNTTAFAILRGARQVVRINAIYGTPVLDPRRANTGSEPTGLAISPTGAKLYVTNWDEGTITVVNTADMTVASTIDLNASLAATGFMGTVTPRPALAHPRSIVITNNGDTSDDDETAYVTEFFAQSRTAGVPTDDSQWDQNRQGLVYRFNLGTGTVGTPITLAPIANTGFQDSAGNNAGCFPNQLYGITLNHNRVYVSSVCASPRGPIGAVVAGTTTNVANFKTEVFSLVSVIDTTTNAEAPTQSVLMTQRWQAAYDLAATPDDATRRMPLIVNDLAFVPSSSIMYSTSYGSDAVFRVQFAADGSVTAVGSTVNNFIDLNPGGTIGAGQLPNGIAIANSGGVALTLNETTRNVSIITLASQSVASAVASADAPSSTADVTRNVGRRLFVTGLARWSLRGQGWNSCEACHNDGLTDNVTWFFARGPRQTTSLDATYAPDGVTQRVLNWTAINDEVHDFELNTRGNSGGLGAVVHANSTPASVADRIIFDGTAPAAGQVATATPQNGLNGSVSAMVPPGTGVPATPSGTALSVRDDWTSIDAYLRTIAAPHAPTNLVAADIAAGRLLFQMNNCGACHGGSDWTISRRFYSPDQTVNSVMPVAGSLRLATYLLPAAFPAALNPTAAVGRMGTLRHSNLADAAANDQINCLLRAVGTFPAAPDANSDGVAPTGVPVREVRADMTTLAQGATGYNPPSLLGMATGAPYFHGANARTLEEVFSTTFAAHYTALSTNFLSTGDPTLQIRQLVAYLLSIDESTTAESVMATLPYNPDLCPATFP